MCAQDAMEQEIDLSEFARQFLDNHPEVKDALDSFGIAFDYYLQYLAAEQTPVFYTANSTVEGGVSG